jgi:Flp pilus assembly pilin Flp
VARRALVRNDAIEWNAIVVIVSLVMIVAFTGDGAR